MNEASFVDQAWERRLRSIATAGLSRTMIERVIVAIARAYTDLPGWPPSDERLMELLAERMPPVSMPVDEVRAAVALLERSGLLTRSRSGDSFAAPELIELREDSFWALRVAEMLHARALEDAAPAARQPTEHSCPLRS